MSCHPRSPENRTLSGCAPSALKRGGGDLLTRIVQTYLESRAEGEEKYLRYYAMQRTLPDAITKAALAELPSGKRFSHQRRIPRAVLERAREVLLGLNYDGVQTFDDLFQLVAAVLRPIRGVGELMVYDTVHRLGAFFQVRPVHVYLHAGVRTGAKALGLDTRKDKLAMSELPRAFQNLLPEQVEDCLCIFKAELKMLGSGGDF
jgi:hypothetical protein